MLSPSMQLKRPSRTFAAALLLPASLVSAQIARAQAVFGGFSGVFNAGSVDTYGFFGPINGSLDGQPFTLTYSYDPSAFSLECSQCVGDYASTTPGTLTETLTANGKIWSVVCGLNADIDIINSAPGSGPSFLLLNDSGDSSDYQYIQTSFQTSGTSTINKLSDAAKSGTVTFFLSGTKETNNYTEVLYATSNPEATIQFRDPATGNNIDASDSEPHLKVYVGEQISLSATTPNVGSVVSQQWTVTDGEPIGGYVHNTSRGETKPLPENDQPGFVFYWTSPSPPGPNYKVTYTSELADGTPITGEAEFEVDPAPTPAPSEVDVLLTKHAVTCNKNGTNGCDLFYDDAQAVPQDLYVGFGNPQHVDSMGNYNRIGFEAHTSIDPGNGYFEWVQLILSGDSEKVVSPPGKKTHETHCRAVSGLDGNFPYAYEDSTGLPLSAYPMNDSPDVDLQNPPNVTSSTRSFKAQAYLMWTSLLPYSLPVPLGSIVWSFNETTSVDPTAPFAPWSTPIITSEGGRYVADEPGVQPSFPEWTGLTQDYKCDGTKKGSSP